MKTTAFHWKAQEERSSNLFKNGEFIVLHRIAFTDQLFNHPLSEMCFIYVKLKLLNEMTKDVKTKVKKKEECMNWFYLS